MVIEFFELFIGDRMMGRGGTPIIILSQCL